MKTLALLGTAAILAAAPASIGLIGNASFSEDVPVRPPATATLLDDQGNAVPPASPRHTEQRSGRHEVEPGGHHGGDRPRPARTEGGDDHRDGADRSGSDAGGKGDDGSRHGGSDGDDGDRRSGSGSGDDGGHHGRGGGDD